MYNRTFPRHFLRILLLLLCFLLSLSLAHSGGLGGFIPGGEPEAPPEPVLSLEKGPLPSPLRIDLNVRPSRRNDHLLVTDHFAKAIYSVDRDDPGQVVKLFDVTGHPMALASYGSRVFVGNRSKGEIQLYRVNDRLRSAKGRLVKTFKTGAKIFPRDFAIDRRSRRLLVVDGYDRNVKSFTFSGRLAAVFDGFGGLYEPQAVAVDARSRKVVVTDFGNPALTIEPSLQVFSAGGELLVKIDGDGLFSSPRGVTVGDGRIYMVDALLGQILVYDLNAGTYLGRISSFGTSEGQLFVPSDVAFEDENQTLYVTSRRMGRVVAFDARAYAKGGE